MKAQVMAIGVLFSSCMPLVGCSHTIRNAVSPEPSKHELANTLHEHLASFVQLRQFVNEPPQIWRVLGPDDPIEAKTGSGELSADDLRGKLVRDKMSKLHVLSLINDSANQARFTMWLGPDSLRDREMKGIMYATTPPSPLVDDLEDESREKLGYPPMIFSRIDTNWYAFWEN